MNVCVRDGSVNLLADTEHRAGKAKNCSGQPDGGDKCTIEQKTSTAGTP